MAVEMTIPDYHNWRRLPTHKLDNFPVGGGGRAVLYNEDNMEKSEDEEEEKGSRRPRQSPEDNMEDTQG